MQEFIDWYSQHISMGMESRIVFATQLFFAELLFMLPYRRRKGFAWRLPIALLIYIGAAYFFPENQLNLGSYITIPIFALSVLLHWFCSAYSFKKVMFNGIGAYALQNFTVNIGICLRDVFPVLGEYRILVDFVCAAIIFPLGWLAFARRSAREEDINIKRVAMMLLTVGVVLLVDVLVKFATWQGIADNLIVRVSMSCSDILALLLQYSSFSVGKLEQENERMEALLRAEREQYRLSRETIDLVNIKCHDLKHSLSQIRANGGKDSAEQLRDIEDAVLFYENVAKTGNEALDSVLTQKSLTCETRGINFTYMADGSRMGRIQPSDVWSMLGNALDNAIESAAREKDEENRILFLNIGAKGDFLCIHVENYCSHPVTFEDGLPLTTKDDKQNHGIGTRSIRYIAGKYGGNAVFSLKDNFFMLDILIPIE